MKARAQNSDEGDPVLGMMLDHDLLVLGDDQVDGVLGGRRRGGSRTLSSVPLLVRRRMPAT